MHQCKEQQKCSCDNTKSRCELASMCCHRGREWPFFVQMVGTSRKSNIEISFNDNTFNMNQEIQNLLFTNGIVIFFYSHSHSIISELKACSENMVGAISFVQFDSILLFQLAFDFITYEQLIGLLRPNGFVFRAHVYLGFI